jgi:GTPase SAR1 family protein
MLAAGEDVDVEAYQRQARSRSMHLVKEDGETCRQVMDILHEMFPIAHGPSSSTCFLLLIVGPAASGKSTLLKRFALEVVYQVSKHK